MSDKQHIQLTIPASSDYIAVVRLAISGVASRMNFTVDEIEDIKVAISEACTNVVQHAYGDDGGTIHIDCVVEGDELTLEIKDTGKGFTPTQAKSEKGSPEDGHFGLGLGLTFIKSLMDSMTIDSEPGAGCTVRMSKRLSKVNA